eukprot:TRINITY_DN1718_c0_g1_i1.p1 TRINITY_DN1718_c0_g1~~TRINITY_DN1718_c0_g1_i1.p1  ORF type:complete len:232 (+),score=45.21 TRINITY_DN1718_c0_g1_i1:25-720(+)
MAMALVPVASALIKSPLSLTLSRNQKIQGTSSIQFTPGLGKSVQHSRHATRQSSVVGLATCSGQEVPDDVNNSSGSRRNVLVAGLAAAIIAPTVLGDAEPARADFCKEFAPTPSGLEFCDAVVGGGIEPQKGMLIKAHYTGRLTSGQVFDSSYGRGKPLVFKVGVGEVIRGWDQGILGGEGIPPMQAGGKRTLRIPSDLAYGSRGAGCRGGSCVIPPDSTLIFDVEFVGKA